MKADPVGFELNRIVTAGDTCQITMNFHEDDVPVDKSGSEFFYTAKSNKADADSAAVIAIEPASVVNQNSGKAGGVNDQVVITLTATNTTLTAGNYYHDIQEVEGAVVVTIAEGILQITAGVTIRTT